MKWLIVFPLAILAWIINYYAMPVYNVGFSEIWIWGLVFVAIVLTTLSAGNEQLSSLCLTIFVAGLVILCVVGIGSTASLFHAQSYRNLIGPVVEKDFQTALPPIDIQNAPLVSEHMAEQAAQKKLSDIPALGSQVVMGEFIKQNIGGKLYWVAFLEHTGIFQWNNTGFTPGYIKVSATNGEDVELVQQVLGKKLEMKYIQSAYFSDNAFRRIYAQVKTLGITSLMPEVDDEGNPFIVASLYDHKVGVSGADNVAVAVLNVQTGEVKTYSHAEIPKWVDRVQPESIIEQQVDDWGKYINGWFNPSDKGKLTISDSIDLVYGEDGQCYYYLGISSIGKDNGIVGFMLINSKTKETTLFHISGASESVASMSAIDVIPEKKYHTTNPLPFSVDGVPTYIMTLTDQNGIPRGYGMVNIQHYQELAVSDTLKSTYQLYLNKLARQNGNVMQIDEKKEAFVNEVGTIDRIASESKNGTTIYYLTIKESKQIFTSTSDLSEKLVLSRTGDRVKIYHEKNNQKVNTMNRFENESIK